MKKVVRTVWISILTGLAFLAACTCPNKMTKTEKKQAKQERDSITDEVNKTEDPRQFTPKTVYGPPPANPNRIKRFEQRKSELEERLQLLIETINEREGSELYGSPEVIEEYRQETEELRKEAADVERELLQLNKDLDRMKKNRP